MFFTSFSLKKNQQIRVLKTIISEEAKGFQSVSFQSTGDSDDLAASL